MPPEKNRSYWQETVSMAEGRREGGVRREEGGEKQELSREQIIISVCKCLNVA
jgi:hypothetical protein